MIRLNSVILVILVMIYFGLIYHNGLDHMAFYDSYKYWDSAKQTE